VNLRTALSAAATGLPVFNPGGRILIFGDPLWIGVEAMAVALTTHYALLIKLVSVGAVAGGAFVVLRRQAGPMAWLLAAGLAFVSTFREGLSCGLEVPLVVLLLGLAVVRLRENEGSGQRPPLVALIALGALLMLTRYEAIVILLPAVLWRVSRRISPSELPRMLAAASPVALWLGLSLAIFGGVIPHGLHPSVDYRFGLYSVVASGMAQWLDLLQEDPVCVLIVGAALAKTALGLLSRRNLDYSDWLGVGLWVSVILSLFGVTTGTQAAATAVKVWAAFLVLARHGRIPKGILSLALASVALFFVDEGNLLVFPRNNLIFPLAWPSLPFWRAGVKSTLGPAHVVLSSSPGRTGLELGPSSYVLDSLALSDPFWSSLCLRSGVEIEGAAKRLPAIGAEHWVELSGDPTGDAVRAVIRVAERPAGVSEPMLSVGNSKDGDVYMISYLGGAKIRLTVYKAISSATLYSPVLGPVDFSRTHEVMIKFGLGTEPAPWADRGEISWDGTVVKVIEAPNLIRRYSHAELALGWNTLKAPNCASAFSGTWQSAEVVKGETVRSVLMRSVAFANRATTIELRLPPNSTAPLPIVVTGHESAGDCLLVQPIGPDSVKFGHDHWGGKGIQWGRPMPFDFGKAHQVEIVALREGYGGFLQREITFIRLDGRFALLCSRSFNPYRDDEVFLLENPIGMTSCDPIFSGEVLSVRSQAPSPGLVEAVIGLDPSGETTWRQIRSRQGPLELTVLFDKAPYGRGQSLVETGHNGKGDVLYLVQEDLNHFHFGFDHWGIGGAVGPRFEVDTSVPHDIKVSMSSLLSERDRSGNAGQWVIADVDGKRAFEANLPCYEARPDELYIGWNRIGASTTEMPFRGRVLDVHRGE